MSDELLFKEFKNQCVQSYKVYIKPQETPYSSKKIDRLLRIADLQHYYQCNPVRFINDFFHIELLDAQAWILTQAWNCPHVLLVCTRGFGKSTLIDLMLMAKGMLFNNYWCYICSGSSSQAQTTFNTLEKLANDNIDTMVGSTGSLFKHELVVKAASGDGFNHGNDGFSYELYNGAMSRTLNSNISKMRGKRGNVVFDEASFLSEEMLSTYAAFAIVNKSFKTGKDGSGKSLDISRIRSIPEEIPNQLFYISSASSTDTEYYRLFREYSKNMFMGDDQYFVALIDCEIVFEPTLHGKVIKPLLEKSTVDSEMRINPEKARREYYCMFTTEAGADAIVKRGVITRNEETRKPELYNETGEKRYIITYDPARQRDNSFILVGELYEDTLEDGSPDLKVRLVNGINLIDMGKKIKSPMQTPDQVEYLKKVILDYNAGADAYGNIVGIYIDAGSGGGGVNIADYLMPNFTDKAGVEHRGLIDREFSAEYVKRFPDAVDKVHLMNPGTYKSIMYESLIEMVNQNKISFTASYDHKGYLTVFDVDKKLLNDTRKRLEAKFKKEKVPEAEIEAKVNEELGKLQSVKTRMIKLDWADELALSNIDALKEETVAMIRKKRDTGRDSFELTPEKQNKMHDDRAYCLALMAYGLAVERRKLILQRPRRVSTDELFTQFSIKKPTRASRY